MWTVYLTEANLKKVFKKQYIYKLRACMNLFLFLAAAQGLALLFSLGGIGASGSGSTGVMLMVKSYSSSIIITFTFFWAFVAAILLTTRDYRDMDFTFVTNRLSSNLSNMVFLVTAAAAGGLTAILGGVLLRIIVYYSSGPANLLIDNFFVPPAELFIGFMAAFLYLFLISSVGYLCGVLVQLSRAFIVILPALFIGAPILAERSDLVQNIVKAGDYILLESSLPLLAAKTIFIGGLLFSAAALLSNKLEVRK